MSNSRGRDPVVTSRMMARVRHKHSKAELAIRRRLFRRGLRYRVHSPLIGKPDIVFTKRRVVIFIDGDFWHGNAWRLRGLASLADLFPNRTEWWVAKISRTMRRDEEVTATLSTLGWLVLRYWESAVLADPEAIAAEIETIVRAR